MSKNIDWQNIEGAFDKKRKLKLRASEEENTLKCPVKYCDHEGFKTESGCRKHIKSRHGWYYFLTENQMYKTLQIKYAAQRKHAAQTTSEGWINVERMTFLLFQKIQSLLKTFASGWQAWLEAVDLRTKLTKLYREH